MANHTESDPMDPELERKETQKAFTLDGVRRQGNMLFRKEDWVGAVMEYSLCIDTALEKGETWEGRSKTLKDVIKLAYSNRSEALLRLKQFEESLADAEKALELDPTHLKSLLRQGRAAMEVGLYEKARDAFEAILEKCPNEPLARRNLQSCREKLERSDAANQDKKLVPALSKYADYIGPVEIRRVDYGDGRRGLFAKERIKSQNNFIVSNAMAVVTNQAGGIDRLIHDMSSSSLDLSDSSSYTRGLAHDHDVLAQLVQRDASSKRSKAQLCSLATAGKEEMEVPSMELFNPGSEWAPPSASTVEVDVNHIRKIVKFNSFSNGHCGVSSTYGNNVGLWILPSFVNHSCVPNCTTMTIRKTKFVRAARDIEPDEELTISYTRILFSAVEDRARKLSFDCRCQRCFLEKKLDAAFSRINIRVGVLVPESKQEFGDGDGRSQPIKPGREKYLATRELANLTNRLEALIGSLDMETTAQQRGWIRAGFLEAYLAKYQLATVHNREVDADTRIDTLQVIVDTMLSIPAVDSTKEMAHLLLHDAKGRYSEESNEYKTAEDLARRAVDSFYGKEVSALFWSDLTWMKPDFDYCTFSFNYDPTSAIPPLL